MTLAAPMKPLATLAWAMLLVVLDLRIDGVDLVPDPVGWVIGAVAANSLSRSAGASEAARLWFRVAALSCAVMVLPAVPEFLGAQHWVLTFVFSVGMTLVVFATCTGIMGTLPARRDTANVVRWVDVGTAAALLAVGLVTELDRRAMPLLLLVGLATAVMFVWFLVLLFGAAKETETA